MKPLSKEMRRRMLKMRTIFFLLWIAVVVLLIRGEYGYALYAGIAAAVYSLGWGAYGIYLVYKAQQE